MELLNSVVPSFPTEGKLGQPPFISARQPLQGSGAGKNLAQRANPIAETAPRNTRLANPTGSSNTLRRSSMVATGCPL